MTRASDSARTANLLAAFSLAAAERVTARTSAATGLPASDTAALVALTTFLGGASQDALAGVLALTQSGAVRLVDRLTRHGLLERRAGPDGRTLAIVATAAGQRAAHRARGERQAAATLLLETLGTAERHQLAALLDKLLGGMTDGRAAARRICRLCDPAACGHHEGRCPVTRAADSAASRPAGPVPLARPPAGGDGAGGTAG